MKLNSASPEQTQAVGRNLGKLLVPGDVVVFIANLGAGKTTFIQGVMEGVSVKEDVLSPTFVLAQTFIGFRKGKKIPLHHLDFYRVTKKEVLEFGISDYLLGAGEIEKGIVLIEWADRVKEIWPDDRLEIHIQIKPGVDVRSIEILGHGSKFKNIVSRLKNSL